MGKLKPIIFSVCILLPLLVGAIGGYITYPAISSWYIYLQKPIISPPNWIFGPVWTALYILMGISSYLIFKKGLVKKNFFAAKIYGLQLLLNLLWSLVFFGLQSISAGLVVILLLWIIILLTIKEFSRINKTAGLLLWPYIFWVSFASILNLLIFLQNR